jgi:hypothetical protein
VQYTAFQDGQITVFLQHHCKIAVILQGRRDFAPVYVYLLYTWHGLQRNHDAIIVVALQTKSGGQVHINGAGAAVGISDVIFNRPRTSSVTANNTVEVFYLSAKAFRTIMKSNEEVLALLLQLEQCLRTVAWYRDAIPHARQRSSASLQACILTAQCKHDHRTCNKMLLQTCICDTSVLCSFAHAHTALPPQARRCTCNGPLRTAPPTLSSCTRSSLQACFQLWSKVVTLCLKSAQF